MKKIKPDAIMDKLKIKTDKNTKLKICAVALVICMFAVLLTSFGTNPKEKKNTTDSDTDNKSQQLEDQLVQLIAEIKGAGRVKVMITYDTSDENVYAKDTDEEFENMQSNTGGQRIKSEYIIVKGSDGEEGLRIKNILPTVRGVAVVCDGANDPNIKGQIIATVSALFDINSTRISVAEMAD